MYNSFFLNSYDSSILLHTHSFFNYLQKKNYNRIKFIKKLSINFFKKNDNYKLYNNIINSYNKFFLKSYKKNLNLYFVNFKKNLLYNLYKTNLLFLFQNKDNILLRQINLKLIKYSNIFFEIDKINLNIYKKNIIKDLLSILINNKKNKYNNII
jgi:hypothetical protein